MMATQVPLQLHDFIVFTKNHVCMLLDGVPCGLQYSIELHYLCFIVTSACLSSAPQHFHCSAWAQTSICCSDHQACYRTPVAVAAAMYHVSMTWDRTGTNVYINLVGIVVGVPVTCGWCVSLPYS